jgi:hypothetical protein
MNILHQSGTKIKSYPMRSEDGYFSVANVPAWLVVRRQTTKIEGI